jgi:hypothetical protein
MKKKFFFCHSLSECEVILITNQIKQSTLLSLTPLNNPCKDKSYKTIRYICLLQHHLVPL